VGSQHHEVSGGVNRAVAAGWDHVMLPRSCFDDTKGIMAVQELTGWSASNAIGASTGEEAQRQNVRTHHVQHCTSATAPQPQAATGRLAAHSADLHMRQLIHVAAVRLQYAAGCAELVAWLIRGGAQALWCTVCTGSGHFL
jgi:hypothetical protein